MNKAIQKEMNRFLSAIHMGNSIFGLFSISTDERILKILEDAQKRFYQHEKAITGLITKKGFDPNDHLLMTQKCALSFEKIKVSLMKKQSFDILKEMITTLQMGYISAITFHREHLYLPDDFIIKVKEIILDYEALLSEEIHLLYELANITAKNE